jgi:tRNA pseudouridine55 synthase
MAEGAMIVLIGDECKNKTSYTNLDKEYEVEVLFGVSTDTGDLLGLPRVEVDSLVQIGKNGDAFLAQISDADQYSKFVGTFMQTYPAYSSKTVNGTQLHTLARQGRLPSAAEMPKKQVEIKRLEFLGAKKLDKQEILSHIATTIGMVKGDFRQKEIIQAWNKLMLDISDSDYLYIAKIRVICTSGTYMRSLAERIGREFGTGACAYSIKRTKIFLYDNMLV